MYDLHFDVTFRVGIWVKGTQGKVKQLLKCNNNAHLKSSLYVGRLLHPRNEYNKKSRENVSLEIILYCLPRKKNGVKLLIDVPIYVRKTDSNVKLFNTYLIRIRNGKNNA